MQIHFSWYKLMTPYKWLPITLWYLYINAELRVMGTMKAISPLGDGSLGLRHQIGVKFLVYHWLSTYPRVWQAMSIRAISSACTASSSGSNWPFTSTLWTALARLDLGCSSNRLRTASPMESRTSPYSSTKRRATKTGNDKELTHCELVIRLDARLHSTADSTFLHKVFNINPA